MSANAIIRWLLSTGRTYTTVGKLQAALVEQIVEYVPVDRLWCGTTVLHPQAAATTREERGQLRAQDSGSVVIARAYETLHTSVQCVVRVTGHDRPSLSR